MIAERIVRDHLEKAGIFKGNRAGWDIDVKNPRFYSRVLRQGSIGLGESYMDGWWDCEHLDQFFDRLLRAEMPWFAEISPANVRNILLSILTNREPRKDAFKIGKEHYDLGQLFDVMLDVETNTYSCAFWENMPKDAEHLGEAQLAKYELVCRKLGLRKGQRILDIGCGWGGFAHYAATRYGAEVVGITVSEKQRNFATERCKGLPVKILRVDYRNIQGKFDHIVSIGMFEHVGTYNHRTFMEVVKSCLKPGGLFLLHTILSPDEFFNPGDPWIRKWIFPIGQIPTYTEITNSSLGLFNFRDEHYFGEYYDPTLMAWYSRFMAGWPSLESEYGQLANGRFYRAWDYYLRSSAGAFRAGDLNLLQAVFSHPGENKDYCPVLVR